MDTTTADRLVEAAAELIGRREAPGMALHADAEAIAETCRAMAARFARGGNLLVFGNGDAVTDAQHLVVEFVHPVIVGKRALPALALTSDVATLTGVATTDGAGEVFARQIACFAGPDDIALGLAADAPDEGVTRGLAAAHDRGLLTVALTGAAGVALAEDARIDHLLVARAHDRAIVKEMHVTTYHLLWELVHVFLEQPAALTGPAT